MHYGEGYWMMLHEDNFFSNPSCCCKSSVYSRTKLIHKSFINHKSIKLSPSSQSFTVRSKMIRFAFTTEKRETSPYLLGMKIEEGLYLAAYRLYGCGEHESESPPARSKEWQASAIVGYQQMSSNVLTYSSSNNHGSGEWVFSSLTSSALDPNVIFDFHGYVRKCTSPPTSPQSL